MVPHSLYPCLFLYITLVYIIIYYLKDIISLCDSSETTISNVHFLRVITLLNFIWMAKHSCFSIVFLDFLWVLDLVHAYSLPAIIRPEDVLKSTEEYLNVILHGSSTNPIVYSLFVLFVCFISVFSVNDFLIKHLLYNFCICLFLFWLFNLLL